MNGNGQTNGRRWRWWPTAALITFIPLLLVGLALWFGSEYRRLGSSELDSERAYARQLMVSELFSSMKDAETGQRGYVLTGDQAFLAPYRAGRADTARHFEALRAGPIDNAVESRRLDRLQALSQQKFAEMERIITVRRTDGLNAAAALVSQGRGKRLMDDIRAETARIRASEARTLADTLARQNERTRLTERVTWIIVAIVSLMFLLVGLSLWRSDRERAAIELQAREAATRRRAIFENVLDALVLINPSGSIETINPAASRLFGYSEEELIRRDISLVVDLAPGDGPFLQRVGLGPDGLAEPFRNHLSARRGDGGTVPVEAALGLMALPDGDHIVAAFRDISEREKSERIKDQFLSTVSHELRTPLTSIIGSLGLLRGGIAEQFSPNVQRLLVIAENNATRLIRLVNDLLDIEKFESGQMAFDFHPMDLRESAEKAIDAVRGLAQTNAVSIDIDSPSKPVTVRADGDRLMQVMTNLLSNAVRFTPAGRTVSLKLGIFGGFAQVTIEDEGPGVDEELRGRLFTRFAQSIQAPTGAARGTGLGLAISREIVRNHGGAIWYEPAEGGGSIFSFNLPLWNMLTKQTDLHGAPRVLICASDAEAKTIADALANRSIRADVVHDGPAAIAALKDQPYLAMLLDCHCPGIEDTALLRAIRSDPDIRGVPVIAICGNDEDQPPEFASLDLIDWMPKPIDTARLNQALSSVMERAFSAMPLVLHVDDDYDTLELTSSALEGRARMARAGDVASARAFIAENRPDVVIVDLALPDGSGHDLIADLALPGALATPVIIYSAQDSGGGFARDVSAVLTKSKRSLPALVETVIEILGRQNDRGDVNE